MNEIDRPPGWKVGDLIPSRGCGRCYGCHYPWWAASRTHSVAVTEDGMKSAFAMCERCWAAATLEGRLAAYRWLVLMQWGDAAAWWVCEAAIRADAGNPVDGSKEVPS